MAFGLNSSFGYYDDDTPPQTQAEDPAYATAEFAPINKKIADKMEEFKSLHKKLIRDENKHGRKSAVYVESKNKFDESQREYVALLKLRAYNKANGRKKKNKHKSGQDKKKPEAKSEATN